MSLRSRIAAFISPQQRIAVPPIEFHPPSTRYYGAGLSAQPNHSTLLNQSIGVADYATRAIANRIMGLNPLVKVTRQVEAGTTVDETLDDNALKLLLDRPHPSFSRSQLLRLTAQWVVTTGEAYWLKVRNGIEIPAQLHPIPPALMSPILSGGVVIGYALTKGNGQQETLPADAVVRFFFPDPENPWMSEGYLGPNATNTDAAKFATQHLRAHFQNDATPKTVLELQEGATAFKDEAQAQRFWGLWRQRFQGRGGEMQGLPAMLPPLWKLVQLSMQSGADIAPLLQFYQDDQLMNFGVPRSALGQVVSGDRSSAEVNDWVMDKHAVKPITDLIEEALTLQLAPDFDASLFVEFEKFVMDDKDFVLRQEDQDLRLKVRSINEVREARGDDPADWGDKPVGTFADVPYTGDAPDGGNNPFSMDPEPADDEPDDEPRERSYTRISLDEINRIAEALTDEPMREAFAAELRNMVSSFGQASLIEVSASGTLFATTDPRVLDFIQGQAALKVTMIGDTTKQSIRDALYAGTEAGEGIGSLAARIGDVFTQARGYRSRMIARTETVAAQTFSASTAYAQAGIQWNSWLSSRDDAVRDTHARGSGLDGERVIVGGNFRSPSGAVGPGPGRMGSAADDINCRCDLLPERTEAAGIDIEVYRVAHWRAKEARRRPWEARLGRVMRALFSAQEAEIQVALRETTQQEAA